jgi:hypothetical protein
VNRYVKIDNSAAGVDAILPGLGARRLRQGLDAEGNRRESRLRRGGSKSGI